MISWTELAGTAAGLMGRRARVVTLPPGLAYAAGFAAEIWSRISRRPGIVSRDKIVEAGFPAWVCDPSRAAAELDFRARTSMREGLATTLAWYKEAGWLRY